MPDKGWKAFERRIAKVFGGKRRGADYRDQEGGKDDIIHPHWAIECKLLGRPSFAGMQAACRQAEAASRIPHPGENLLLFRAREPVAVIKKKGARDNDALVVMRLETFKEWRL